MVDSRVWDLTLGSCGILWPRKCTPWTHRTRAMLEERFGSYSIRSTMPIEEVPRLTSTFLCNLLAPPPRWKEVMRPAEFLPAIFDELRVRRFSAPTFARSLTSEIADWRGILLTGTEL